MWTGHRPLWRGSKTGLTSSPVETQSHSAAGRIPLRKLWEYVKTEEAEAILDQIANLKHRTCCPYCEGDEALFHDEEHGISTFIDSHGNLMVTAGEKTAEFPVEFCPKCGRQFNAAGQTDMLSELLAFCDYDRLLQLAQADKARKEKDEENN